MKRCLNTERTIGLSSRPNLCWSAQVLISVAKAKEPAGKFRGAKSVATMDRIARKDSERNKMVLEGSREKSCKDEGSKLIGQLSENWEELIWQAPKQAPAIAISQSAAAPAPRVERFAWTRASPLLGEWSVGGSFSGKGKALPPPPPRFHGVF